MHEKLTSVVRSDSSNLISKVRITMIIANLGAGTKTYEQKE